MLGAGSKSCLPPEQSLALKGQEQTTPEEMLPKHSKALTHCSLSTIVATACQSTAGERTRISLLLSFCYIPGTMLARLILMMPLTGGTEAQRSIHLPLSGWATVQLV